jgi:hypothetical protein
MKRSIYVDTIHDKNVLSHLTANHLTLINIITFDNVDFHMD